MPSVVGQITKGAAFTGLIDATDLITGGPVSKTLASDAFTQTAFFHVIQPQSGTTDDLSTITPLAGTPAILLRAEDAADTITIKHNVGNILISGGTDFVLGGQDDFAIGFYDSALTKWVIVGGRAAGVTDHGALTGLGDDDHPQYLHDTGAESAAGLKTFADGIATDTIAEKTGAAGVTIDESLVKDGAFFPKVATMPNTFFKYTASGGGWLFFQVDGSNYIGYSVGTGLWYFYNGGNSILEITATTIDAKVHKIVNVVDPGAAQDAATKKYVDDNAITPAVLKSLYDAYTILMATADNTPVALTVDEQTLVGRITSGAIAALSIAQVKTLLGAGVASGLATLSAGTLVVENPANATATPTASKIPIADGAGKLDGWLTDPLPKSVRLTAAPASDHTANGIIIALTAGENVVFGDACYIKSDGKMWKADADAIATGGAVALAIATIAADASGDFLLQGIARDDTWAWTVGGLIFLSTTPGPPTQTAPSGTDDVIQVVGVATHADRMLWMPQLTQVEHT